MLDLSIESHSLGFHAKALELISEAERLAVNVELGMSHSEDARRSLLQAKYTNAILQGNIGKLQAYSYFNKAYESMNREMLLQHPRSWEPLEWWLALDVLRLTESVNPELAAMRDKIGFKTLEVSESKVKSDDNAWRQMQEVIDPLLKSGSQSEPSIEDKNRFYRMVLEFMKPRSQLFNPIDALVKDMEKSNLSELELTANSYNDCSKQGIFQMSVVSYADRVFQRIVMTLGSGLDSAKESIRLKLGEEIDKLNMVAAHMNPCGSILPKSPGLAIGILSGFLALYDNMLSESDDRENQDEETQPIELFFRFAGETLEFQERFSVMTEIFSAMQTNPGPDSSRGPYEVLRKEMALEGVQEVPKVWWSSSMNMHTVLELLQATYKRPVNLGAAMGGGICNVQVDLMSVCSQDRRIFYPALYTLIVRLVQHPVS